jgi:replicative DNA helicase
MNRKDAAREIKGRWRDLYPADDKGRGKGIVCPICGSGSGPNGTGISEKKGSSSHFLKCWNGACDFNEGGSVIDLYMLEHGMNPQADFARAVDELAGQLGIVIDAPAGRTYAWDDFIPEDGEEPQDGEQLPPAGPSFTGQTSATASASAADPGQQGQTSAGGDTVEQVQGLTVHTVPAEEPAEEPAADPTAKPARTFGGYYLASQKRLQDSPEARAYLQRRGISMETAARYVLGYDPAWVSPTVIEKLEAEGNSWRPAGTPRIIIPSGYTHYVARDIRADADIPEAGQKYKKMNEGSAEIFGLYRAMHSEAENIFITEGAFDALSIIEAGQLAIALNSTSNADKLIKTLEAEPVQATFIICLDSDAAGRKTSAKLQDGLRRLNISCIEADINGAYKDPNEHLQQDRAGFEAAIERAIAATAARPDSAINYIENGGLVADIERRRAIGKKPTGFANLDAKIGGGLRPGLFLLGAISSLGKTTFCSQLADGVAAAGNEVIYFSLEQSRLEMVAKCLARETAKIDMDRAVTGGQIMDGYRADIITQAARNYTAAVGDRISIIEAGLNTDAQFIADYVRNYHRRTGARPVVIIDYLQALCPEELPNGRTQDTRQSVEASLRQLVLLKRELDLTIIAIVSLNRNNYLQPFDFESIKETGLAEYSADTVWGLQLQCLDDPIFSGEGKLKEKREMVRDAKAAIPRKVKLCSVKHRGQQAIYECNFDYFPQYDLFIPSAEAEAARRPAGAKAGKKL